MSSAKALSFDLPSKQILTSEQYHDHPAIGSTNLKHVLRSPKHYAYERQNPFPQTPATQFGKFCHTAFLEPHIYLREKVILPAFQGTGARAAKEQFLRENHGKIIVTSEQSEAINGMLQAINKHESAGRLLWGGSAEESYFDQCPETGIVRKVRPDYLRGDVIVDVKTTQDASPQAFAKSVANFYYHLSAALYLDVVSSVLGRSFTQFIIIAVEKEPPYGVAVYLLDEGTIEAGRFLYKKALRILKDCKDSGQYPAYPDRVQSLSLPNWAWPHEE